MRFLFAFLLFSPQFLKARETEVVPDVIKQKDAFYAFVPYLNYDSTQSWSLGTAIEKKSKNKEIDTYLVDLEAAPKARLRLETKYSSHINSKWEAALGANFTNFYDPFYGFGMSTKVEDLKKINQSVKSSQLHFSYEESSVLSFGPFIEFNQRTERPGHQIDNRRFFQDETSFSLGGSALYDTRDSKFNPHSGDKHELSLSVVPEELNSLNHTNTFSQIKLDLRKYFPICETVFATRFTVGTTIGEPNYLYKYRLGGVDLLRGYQSNRFIGNSLASLQLEERVNIYKEYIALTASFEAGSINSNPMDKVHSSKGIGLRVAMPPDWTNLLTINFGFGNDQHNASLEFNENF
ncbi:MAG: BamA/TamA family outer membrane protein [Bacteriovorax sp.]